MQCAGICYNASDSKNKRANCSGASGSAVSIIGDGRRRPLRPSRHHVVEEYMSVIVRVPRLPACTVLGKRQERIARPMGAKPAFNLGGVDLVGGRRGRLRICWANMGANCWHILR